MSRCLEFTPGYSGALGDRARPACVPFGWDVQQEGAKQNGPVRKRAFCVLSVAMLEGFHPAFPGLPQD